MTTDQLARTRAPRSLAGLAAAALIAVALPFATALPQTQATGTTPPPAAPPAAVPRVPVVPVTRAFAEPIDGPSDYQAQTLCSPVAKVGAVKLAALITKTYGKTSIGIIRACSNGGVSEHKEGRALDWMVNYKVPAQRAQASDFLTWLLAPDQYGHPAAMATRLGVMYIGWNNQFWRGYDAARGWTDLKGCSTDPKKKAAGFDTYCHRNHVHLSLSWEGAMAMTSFWTGTPLAPTCESPWSSGQPAAVAGLDLVPVTPVRVLDTRVGTGVMTPCRIGAQRWSGDRRDLVVRVTGQGEVPPTGVAAVAIQVTVARTTAPLPTVSARATAGGTLVPVVSPLSASSYASTAVVPVASDGTVRLAIDRGTGEVSVDVLAWAPPAVPQVLPPAPWGPGPPALPAPPTPPAPPAPAAASATSGMTHVVAPVTVYDGTAVPLKPGEARTIPLAGAGGIPAAGLTGLVLAVTTAPSATSNWVGVQSGANPAYVASVRSSIKSVRSTHAVVPTKDGQVTLRNTGKSPVVVQVRLHAWIGDATALGGSPLTLLAAPAKLVDSARKLGLPAAVVNAKPRAVVLSGNAAVPARAQAVLVSVSALGGTTESNLVLTSRGVVQAVGLTPARWSHAVILLPLLPSGSVAVSTASLGTHVRLTVLGYVA